MFMVKKYHVSLCFLRPLSINKKYVALDSADSCTMPFTGRHCQKNHSNLSFFLYSDCPDCSCSVVGNATNSSGTCNDCCELPATARAKGVNADFGLTIKPVVLFMSKFNESLATFTVVFENFSISIPKLYYIKFDVKFI